MALMELWGLYREKSKWAGYNAYLEEQKDHANDRWDYVSKVIRITEELYPGRALRFHSDLLQRAGWNYWLQWLAGLDIPLQRLMLCEIEDLDVYEQLIIGCCADTSLEAQNRLNLLILIIMGCLHLWEQISNNLRLWANDRPAISEEEEKYRQDAENELNNWVNIHMHERAQRVVKIINLGSTEGRTLACLMLSNLQIRDTIRDLPVKYLRHAVVEELKLIPDSVKFVIEKLFLSSVRGKEKLISAWEVLSESKEGSVPVNNEINLWKYYIDWLQSSDFNWSNTPGTDDSLLIQAMADLLAGMEEPVDCWLNAYDEIYYPPEGWGWQYRKHHDSLDRIAQLLPVGFLASVIMLDSGQHDWGNRLFQLVWDKMIYGVRNSYEYYWPSVQVPLSLGWGNLPYVFPETYSEVALKEMEQIENVELLINCTSYLWSSVKEHSVLVSSFMSLNDYLKLRFNKAYPILQAQYGEQAPSIECILSAILR